MREDPLLKLILGGLLQGTLAASQLLLTAAIGVAEVAHVLLVDVELLNRGLKTSSVHCYVGRHGG